MHLKMGSGWVRGWVRGGLREGSSRVSSRDPATVRRPSNGCPASASESALGVLCECSASVLRVSCECSATANSRVSSDQRRLARPPPTGQPRSPGPPSTWQTLLSVPCLCLDRRPAQCCRAEHWRGGIGWLGVGCLTWRAPLSGVDRVPCKVPRGMSHGELSLRGDGGGFFVCS